MFVFELAGIRKKNALCVCMMAGVKKKNVCVCAGRGEEEESCIF
jgi:hypothetical protein